MFLAETALGAIAVSSRPSVFRIRVDALDFLDSLDFVALGSPQRPETQKTKLSMNLGSVSHRRSSLCLDPVA